MNLNRILFGGLVIVSTILDKMLGAPSILSGIFVFKAGEDINSWILKK